MNLSLQDGHITISDNSVTSNLFQLSNKGTQIVGGSDGRYNMGIEAICSLLLAMHMEGIPVNDKRVVNSIETTLDMLQNECY